MLEYYVRGDFPINVSLYKWFLALFSSPSLVSVTLENLFFKSIPRSYLLFIVGFLTKKIFLSNFNYTWILMAIVLLNEGSRMRTDVVLML